MDLASSFKTLKPLNRMGSQWSQLAGRILIDTSLSEDQLRSFMHDQKYTPILCRNSDKN
jgi:hypothetical protein